MKSVFKIRNKEGLYSTGGIRPEWTKMESLTTV